jgi:hypothetical protein
VIDDVLDASLPRLAAITVETATRRPATVISLDDPGNRASVAGNYDLVAEVDPPTFIDEWQLEPQVWDRVR